MSENSPEEIGRQLEKLDDSIHDLLMKRADMAARLADMLKKDGADHPARPDREAAVIARLLARHRGSLPREALARVWREFFAGAYPAKKAAIAITDPVAGLIAWEMACNYFGSVLPLNKVANPMLALSMVKDREAAFAVLPWPENEGPHPWWRFLMDETGKNPMRIVARLPMGEYASDNANPVHKELVVARVPFAPTQDDRTFIALHLEHRVSRARIVDKAQVAGLRAVSLHSSASNQPDFNDHLLECTGYESGDSEKLPRLLKLLESDGGRAVFVGGYPVPLQYDEPAQQSPRAKKTA